MLTKQDLNQIQKIVQSTVNTAIEEFAISLASSFTNIFERLDKIEARLDKIEARLDKIEARLDKIETEMKELKEEVNDLGQQIDSIERKINALYTRGNRHDERLKRTEKELHLPAFA